MGGPVFKPSEPNFFQNPQKLLISLTENPLHIPTARFRPKNESTFQKKSRTAFADSAGWIYNLHATQT